MNQGESPEIFNSASSVKKAIRWVVLVLAVFLCAEALIFRSGLYQRWLEPDSSAGNFEMHMSWLKKPRSSSVPEVLVLGDSRMAEGFSQRVAEAHSPIESYWWNFGIPGTTPRVWYYLLRDADPERNRFHTIVISLENLADLDRFDSGPKRLIDLNFVIGRLRLTDVWEFSSSMQESDLQRTALMGSLLKGNTLRQDFLSFLSDIRKRWEKVALVEQVGLSSNEDYKGNDKNLIGLSIREDQNLDYPPNLDEAVKRDILHQYRQDYPPQSGITTEYRKKWLGKILDLYQNSKTKIIFLEAPRGPVAPITPDAGADFIQWSKKYPNVQVLNQQTFHFLETPETFFDALHLNRKGRELFSEKLAKELSIQ